MKKNSISWIAALIFGISGLIPVGTIWVYYNQETAMPYMQNITPEKIQFTTVL